jgi:AcrR family transcriptional regulator
MSATNRASRRIGRPRPIPGTDAREVLMDAAVGLFAERGIAATTIAQIAHKAGVTPAMVHYYFTNRDLLLDAIAEERLLRTVSAVWAPVMDESSDVPLMVRGLVRRIVQANEAQPWLSSLWLREIVSEGGQLRQRMLKSLPFVYLQHFIAAVAAAQHRREVNPQLDSRLVFVSVIGLTLLPLATMNIWQQVPLLQGVQHKQVAQHAEALLLQGLSVRPSQRGRHR